MTEPRQLPTERPRLRVSDVPERHRYEARLGDGGDLAAFLTYALAEAWIALLHTEVLEGFEGQGIGSRFVQAVFDDVRSRGLRVIPKCPFVVRWLERHPEQHDLLSPPLPAPEPGPRSDPERPA
jgi:hypothetical protein